jgi:hypothetical protein
LAEARVFWAIFALNNGVLLSNLARFCLRYSLAKTFGLGRHGKTFVYCYAWDNVFWWLFCNGVLLPNLTRFCLRDSLAKTFGLGRHGKTFVYCYAWDNVFWWLFRF